MASPIESFAALKVTKTRDRSSTSDLLPPNFDPDEKKDLVAPVAEAQAKCYTKERLQQSLIYAERFLKLRDISPRSEIFMNFYKNSIKDALTAETADEREEYARDILVEEKLIQLEDFLKPSKTAKTAVLEGDLLELRTLQYLARYGDYLQIIPGRIRNHASTQKIEGWRLLSGSYRWTEIADAIVEEEARQAEAIRTNGKNEGRHTTMTIMFACRDLGLSEETAIWSIKEYATRNKQFHNSFEYLKEQGDFPRLASILFADRDDLDTVFSFNSNTNLKHLKEIIQDQIDECFVNTDEFPNTPSLWGPSPAVIEVYKAAQNRAKKPTKDEVKKANIEASEKHSQAKAARHKEASQASSSSVGTKRVASTEEPRESERRERGSKRTTIELLAKRVKLEAQLETVNRTLEEQKKTGKQEEREIDKQEKKKNVEQEKKESVEP